MHTNIDLFMPDTAQFESYCAIPAGFHLEYKKLCARKSQNGVTNNRLDHRKIPNLRSYK